MNGDHPDVINRPQTSGALAGFSAPVADLAPRTIAEAAVAAREEAEIKAAIMLARTAPRNELAGYERVMKSCARPNFATTALYSFPRGGQKVEGPSVDMAREIARAWGNIRYGLQIVDMTEDTVHVRGFAHDIETNAYVSMEDRFARLVQRKGQGWVKPDERDLRELVNRRGAICVRNAILQVLPPDVVDDAMACCRKTREDAATGKLKLDRDATIKHLLRGLADYAVTVAMIEKKIGHGVNELTRDEFIELQGALKSIVDGNSKREDHFPFTTEPTVAGPSTSKLDALADQPTQPQGAAGTPTVTPAPVAPSSTMFNVDEIAREMDAEPKRKGRVL